MVCWCDLVAFCEDLRLQSLVIIIFRYRACVRTTGLSRTVEYTRLENRRKIRYSRRKIRYEVQTGEKSGTTGEKSGISGEKFRFDTQSQLQIRNPIIDSDSSQPEPLPEVALVTGVVRQEL